MNFIGGFSESSSLYVDSVELKLEVGEIHVRLAHHEMIDWPCRNAVRRASCTTINRSGNGGTWIPASIRHPARRAAAQRVQQPWSARGEDAWAEPSSRFTALFELLAIEWLKAAARKPWRDAGAQLGRDSRIHGAGGEAWLGATQSGARQ